MIYNLKSIKVPQQAGENIYLVGASIRERPEPSLWFITRNKTFKILHSCSNEKFNYEFETTSSGLFAGFSMTGYCFVANLCNSELNHLSIKAYGNKLRPPLSYTSVEIDAMVNLEKIMDNIMNSPPLQSPLYKILEYGSYMDHTQKHFMSLKGYLEVFKESRKLSNKEEIKCNLHRSFPALLIVDSIVIDESSMLVLASDSSLYHGSMNAIIRLILFKKKRKPILILGMPLYSSNEGLLMPVISSKMLGDSYPYYNIAFLNDKPRGLLSVDIALYNSDFTYIMRFNCYSFEIEHKHKISHVGEELPSPITLHALDGRQELLYISRYSENNLYYLKGEE